MLQQKTVCALIVAAGSSTRMGFDKLLYKFNSKTVFEHSLHAFENNDFIDEIIVVAGDNITHIKQLMQNCKKKNMVIKGGNCRSQSVKNGIMKATADIVAIHDAARPFVDDIIINETLNACLKYGAAAPSVAVKDTIKITNEDKTIKKTPNRSRLFAVQTPQCFFTKEYLNILKEHFSEDLTDDCSLYEKANKTVFLTQGHYKNIKITTKDDLVQNEVTNINFKIGHGYDVHKFAHDRKLILAGVDIEHNMGLLGHSDADVLAHAVTDALLGAAALGDIGKLFPDTDDKYKGADSINLLKNVVQIITQKGYKIGNVDATVICQAPKLAPYIGKMQENLATALQIETNNVSIKATTEEGLGFTGEKLAIAAHAVCILHK